MRLQVYLDTRKLSWLAFGRLRIERPVPKSTVRQWALGLRFPSTPQDAIWLEAVTAGQVTVREIAEHCAEVRAGATAAGISRAEFVAQQRKAA